MVMFNLGVLYTCGPLQLQHFALRALCASVKNTSGVSENGSGCLLLTKEIVRAKNIITPAQTPIKKRS